MCMRELTRPDGIGNDQWAAITDACERLARAKSTSDHALVVGTAKELCESVAKVVISERGGIATGDDITDLVSTAHKVLAYQPGEDLANDPETRRIAQGLKSIVLGVGELRNQFGTG